jgi:hypothetical protein
LTTARPRLDYPAAAWVAAAISILALLFPAMVAGVSLDAPVQAEELARLRSVLAPDPAQEIGPAAVFYAALVPGDLQPEGVEDALPLARLRVLLVIVLISGLLMATVSIVRGRGTAVLACLALGCLPPIAVDAARIRPELPSTLFAMLGIMFLASMPVQIRMPRGWPLIIRTVAFALVIGTSLGLAIATVPQYGVYLLIPGALMCLVVLLGVWSCLACLRRRGLARWPARAMTARIGPWVLVSFATLLCAALFLTEDGQGEAASVSATGLLPASPWLRWPMLGLGCMAGINLLFESGLALGRGRRIQGREVLLLYAIGLLLHHWQGSELGRDPLPAAAAMAILLAEGLRIAIYTWARRR